MSSVKINSKRYQIYRKLQHFKNLVWHWKCKALKFQNKTSRAMLFLQLREEVMYENPESISLINRCCSKPSLKFKDRSTNGLPIRNRKKSRISLMVVTNSNDRKLKSSNRARLQTDLRAKIFSVRLKNCRNHTTFRMSRTIWWIYNRPPNRK